MLFWVSVNRCIKQSFLIYIVLFLSGCATTQIVVNDVAEMKVYRELYFIPPKEDSRNIVPLVEAEFQKLGLNVRILDPEKPKLVMQGSGFLVSGEGHIFTCQHILGEETQATVWLNGIRHEADVLSADAELDVAILKTRTPVKGIQPLKVRNDRRVKLGEDVYVIGYPISSILGTKARLSKGLVSSTSGIKDDPDQLQISAQVQPGNSGGPLLDENGFVVGIVQKTLNPWKMAQQTGGALPQNVNFALKSDVIFKYMNKHISANEPMTAKNKAIDFDIANTAVARINSGIMSEELENAPKLIVRLEYESFWDIWYRFRFFVLSFYDFDTQELLFRAGQVGDNLMSTEGKVIADTFNMVEKQLNKRSDNNQ